jgi:hypothetical protein
MATSVDLIIIGNRCAILFQKYYIIHSLFFKTSGAGGRLEGIAFRRNVKWAKSGLL